MKLTLIIAAILSAPVHGLYLVDAMLPYMEKAFALPPGPDQKPVPGNLGILQCDVTKSQLLNLQGVVISPQVPVRGENLTFTATGFLKADVTEGAYAAVDVSYGFIKLIHANYDICEEIPKVDLECPIKKGDLVISKSVEIPEDVPPGKYVVTVRAYTKDQILLTCLTHTIEFPPYNQ